MYTQCTSCATLFRVTPRHLRAAHGLVRCCLCHETFDALRSLVDRLPEDVHAGEAPVAPPPSAVANERPVPVPPPGPEAAPPPEPGAAPPLPEQDEGFVLVPDAEAQPETDDHAPVESELGDELKLERDALDLEPDDGRDLFTDLDFGPPLEPEPVPEPAPPPRRQWLSTLGWSLGILLLLALVVIQYAYFRRAELSQDRALRPWLEALCWAAKCELPLLKDVSRVHILQRRISAHPSVSDALLVRATLVNDASFPQPYPMLRLTFLDGGGGRIASRAFTPQEYLEDPRLRAAIAAGMPPKQPVALRLELMDPGPNAADNYRIDFE